MAEYLTRDILLAISNEPEATYNDMYVLASEYQRFQMTGTGFPVPDKIRFDDLGKIGNGTEFPTTQRSGHVIPATMEIADEVNTSIGAILLRRALGGADTTPAGADILEAGVAFRHKWGMLNTTLGRQLPSSSVVYSLGGFDLVWGGCVVDSLTFAQTNADPPTLTAGLVGSGLYKDISDIAPAFGTLPAITIPQYHLGAETTVEFTDSGGTVVLTANQQIRSYTITLNNNHITDDRRMGDPRILASNIKKGWYVNRMLHGDRTVTAEFTVMIDDTLREFFNSDEDEIVTGFRFTTKGYYIGASTTNQYQMTIIVPKCYFRTPRFVDDGGNAEMTISIFPVTGATYGLITAEVVNGVATAIV
jgi:hypothetical protein